MVIPFSTPSHGKALEKALDWAAEGIRGRLEAHFSDLPFDFAAWAGEENPGTLALEPWLGIRPTKEEAMVLLLALMPHLRPHFFESIMTELLPGGGDFSEFGGAKGSAHRGFLPSGETAQFVIAGRDLERRLALIALFSTHHYFARKNLVWLEAVSEGEPEMGGRLVLSREWMDQLIFGKETAPRFALSFPARPLHTEMDWEDLVLHPRTRQQVEDIGLWLHHRHQLEEDENLRRKVKAGYRVLFYGPSGTGKTLTATILGRTYGREVFRVDLSQLVSKFIGETEKNLEQVFRKAEHKDWILFFDEADAIFGKRTQVQTAHDRYANQEVSYLLQRVEDYPGLLILASNFKHNLDEAFLRRFHAVVHFPKPNAQEREILWQKSLPQNLEKEAMIDLAALARNYEMTGASILNAVQFASLRAYARGQGMLTAPDLLEGIRKEFLKEEKSI